MEYKPKTDYINTIEHIDDKEYNILLLLHTGMTDEEMYICIIDFMLSKVV